MPLSAPIRDIEAILRKIKVLSSNATDLSSRVYKYDNLLSTFFNVKSVVDLQSADTMIRSAFDDYGVRYLTDHDLKALQKRIGETEEENRINLGYVDFFGYSTEFFKYLKGDAFKEVLENVMDVKSSLTKHQIAFLKAKIHEEIYEKITIGLLGRKKIHPFSIGIAAPYLVRRLSLNIVSKTMHKALLTTLYPDSTKNKKELISKIFAELYDSSERVMKKDYSKLVGTTKDVDFKIKLFDHIHNGLNNMDDIKNVFDRDIKIIQPILDKIEKTIKTQIPEEQTIVIKDGSFLDNQDEIQKLAKTIKNID